MFVCFFYPGLANNSRVCCPFWPSFFLLFYQEYPTIDFSWSYIIYFGLNRINNPFEVVEHYSFTLKFSSLFNLPEKPENRCQQNLASQILYKLNTSREVHHNLLIPFSTLIYSKQGLFLYANILFHNFCWNKRRKILIYFFCSVKVPAIMIFQLNIYFPE